MGVPRGGPCGGNTVSTGVGTNDFEPGAWNILFQDCLFYGQGGRYALLVYRARDVTVRRIVVRKDGGWAEPGSSAECRAITPPEAGISFYDATNARCEQCVVFDSIKASVDAAEGIGGFLVNSAHPTLSDNDLITGSIIVNTAYSGLAFEGFGRVNRANVSDTYFVANRYNGVTVAIRGDMTLTRIAALNNGLNGVSNNSAFGPSPATVTLTDSLASGNGGLQVRGIEATPGGSGPGPIDLSRFDGARIRREMCDLADPRPAYDLSRDFCTESMTFEQYIRSYLP